MSKHNFEIELLKAGNQAAWSSLYSKLKGIFRSKSFAEKKELDEDLFQEMFIILHSKIDIINSDNELINLSYSIFRNQSITEYKKNARFANRQYTQEDGMSSELTPDQIGGEISEQEAQHEQEQLEYDFEVLKNRFEQVKSTLNKNNLIKKIDLVELYIDYLDDHTLSIEEICKKHNIASPQAFWNINKHIKKSFGLSKSITKGVKPSSELSASEKSRRKKLISEKYGSKNR